jgi:hypothetical protein
LNSDANSLLSEPLTPILIQMQLRKVAVDDAAD